MCQNVIKYEFILEGSSGSFTSFNFRRNESWDLSTSFSLTFFSTAYYCNKNIISVGRKIKHFIRLGYVHKP